ncbi:MAG: TerB family tellurite resistance protein [Litoreibacter sp.]
MIGFLKRLLDETSQTEVPEDDARLAMTALLVKVARSDWDYSSAERTRIDEILTQRYDLSPAEAAELRVEGEKVEADALDTVQFTRAIKRAVDFEDRESVIEALWDLVLSDGHRDQEEDTALRKIAPLLGISDVDSALARQRVQSRRPQT